MLMSEFADTSIICATDCRRSGPSGLDPDLVLRGRGFSDRLRYRGANGNGAGRDPGGRDHGLAGRTVFHLAAAVEAGKLVGVGG